MDSVNKTLYIPLYGKAYVSRKGIILYDPKAEKIWEAEGFPLKGKSKSKWLAYYMGMRSAVMDNWVKEQMKLYPEAVVLHLGCGMDSRCQRIDMDNAQWYDVDFPEVIEERNRYYKESPSYHMIGGDVREGAWLENIKADEAIVVMEGLSMYLKRKELEMVLSRLTKHFSKVILLMDCYTTFAAKASKYKNPINDVGVTTVYGIDDPKEIVGNTGLKFVKEHEMTPEHLVNELDGMENTIFRKVYGGGISKKMYRLYEYRNGRECFLKTDRTVISKWQKDDIELAKSLWGEKDVTRYICASGAFTEEEILARLEKEIKNQEEYQIQYWPVFQKETAELIGCCGLRPYTENVYEIGFHLRSKFWRQGYAVEVANAVIKYAFGELKAEALFAGHNPKNEASKKVLNKLGFQYVRDEFYEPTGLYHPSYELRG